MKSIRIKNLRSLKDTGEVPIKPITLLIGENSSGKSTFLRSLLLLQQSIDSRTRSVIAWWVDRDLVDFGSFQSSLFANTNDNFISFGFNFNDVSAEDLRNSNLDNFWFTWGRPIHSLKNTSLEICLRQHKDSSTSDQITYFSKLCIDNLSNRIVVELEPPDKEFFTKVKKIIVNEEELFSNQSDFYVIKGRSNFIPTGFYNFIPISFYKKDRDESRKLLSLEDELINLIYERLLKFINKNTGRGKVEEAIYKISLDTNQSIVEQLQNSQLKFNKNTIENWTDNSKEFQSVKNLILSFYLLSKLGLLEQILVKFVQNISYSRPVRANPQRSYRSQDLEIEHIDPRGENLAVFLRNLNDVERKSFETWCQYLFGFTPKAKAEGGYIALNLTEHTKEPLFNLIDVGFGYTQILPVITQLWNLSTRTKSQRMGVIPITPITFAIEQPELHLHPKMQSKLARAFVETVKRSRSQNIDVRMILETHSEAIVNQIGRLISMKELDANDVAVVLFERDEKTLESKVRVTGYDAEGFLKEGWPIGFFDSEDV